VDKQIRKLWNMHAMEYYSALKKKKKGESVICDNRVSLEDAMLSEVRKTNTL
jgi:hypothetical protein